MQVLAVAGDGFERVADGVAEVEDRAQAGLGFVLSHHAGLDLTTARDEQFRSVQLVAALAVRSFMGAAKATMKMLGVDVGPARLPNGNLNAQEVSTLRHELETMGFFDWIKN